VVTQLERRAVSAAYRVVTNEGEAQERALSRLGSIAGEEIAWDVWLSTNPDPELVKKVMDRRLMELMRRYSPPYSVTPRKMQFEIPVRLT
jgi:hypothetical protein